MSNLRPEAEELPTCVSVTRPELIPFVVEFALPGSIADSNSLPKTQVYLNLISYKTNRTINSLPGELFALTVAIPCT